MSSAPVDQGGERDTTPLNIYQRRNKAKRAVYEHEFSKTASQGLKYKYIPVDQVKPIVEKAWNDNGIVMDVVETEFSQMRPDWEQRSEYGPSHWFHVELRLKVALVNIDDPEDRVEIEVHGEGKDNSDKAESKAYTAAIKNFFKLEFNIADGPKDDPDAVQSDEEIEAANRNDEANRRAKLEALREQAKDDRFLGSHSKETEAVIDAMGADAAFTDAQALAEAVKARRDSVNIKDARIAIFKFRQSHPEDETIADYVQKFGERVGDWPEEKVIDCYLDLSTEGSA